MCIRDRRYVPCCLPMLTPGRFDLGVKVYPGGEMSTRLSTMPIGSEVMLEGAHGDAADRLRVAMGECTGVLLLVGGTGVFPAHQIVAEVLSLGNGPQFRILHGCGSEADMVLQPEMATLEEAYPTRLRVDVFLEQPPRGWQRGVGFVSLEAIAEARQGMGQSVLYITCGPCLLYTSPSPRDS
eukprot:TRINITY_DN28171_c0_g1_i2.p1 TRINITY_DN28171_c0_g1~~TRINITY_DN28171_c0_g1_i2.p1  ORF type:complete len:194 (+),score=30.06 TRINITY_DN28171_c0_g1_i2:39-584(+)